MTKKTKIAQISTLVSTLLLTALPVRADDLAAPVPAPTDFWVRDQSGRITHACGGKEPLVLCMQGRKVVMQVQSDRTNGFSYTARFFNLQKEVEKKQALYEAGREATPELRVNDQPLKSEFPSSVMFDGLLTLTYPEAGGIVVTRTVYPSMTKALVIEEWQVRNTTDKPVVVMVPPARTVKPVGEDIAIVWSCPGGETAAVKAGGVLSFSTCVQAGLAAGHDQAVNVAAERGARLALAEAAWRGPGRLETPDPLFDHAFALQKLHVLECPIETIKGVITHNGSLTYSPGIWANDPPEYSSPLFPFFGDAELNKASMNMFGIVPTGLDSFECTPWLPKDWPRMALRDLRAFGHSWDLVVERAGDQQKVTVLSGGKALMTGLGPPGKTYALTFPAAVSAKPVWGISPTASGVAGGQTTSPLLTRAADLAGNFPSPPHSAKTGVFWFWVNGNITREGITADLEAMARVGIGRVVIFEVSGDIPGGTVRFLSDEWRALFRHALAEANRLDVKLNINNDAGWSGSGGPWNTPENSMQQLVSTRTSVEGGKPFDAVLPQPPAVKGFYRDILVLATKALPADYDVCPAELVKNRRHLRK